MLCQFCNSAFQCEECRASFYDDTDPCIGIEFIAEFSPKVSIASGEDATMNLMEYLKQSNEGEEPTPSYVGQ
jgi:hypothetical protein